MVAVAFLKVFFNGRYSLAIAHIFTKFDGETENEAPQDDIRQNSRWHWSLFCNFFFNSVAIAHIFTKFDGETENEAQQDVLKSNLYQAKS